MVKSQTHPPGSYRLMSEAENTQMGKWEHLELNSLHVLWRNRSEGRTPGKTFLEKMVREELQEVRPEISGSEGKNSSQRKHIPMVWDRKHVESSRTGKRKLEIMWIVVPYGSPFKARVTGATLWRWHLAALESPAPFPQPDPLGWKEGLWGRFPQAPLPPPASYLLQACSDLRLLPAAPSKPTSLKLTDLDLSRVSGPG